MVMPKYGAATDANQKEIVDALLAIGCDVDIIGRPLDLLVGYRKLNFLIEVKIPGGENRKCDQEQRDWIKNWRGQARVVTTPEQAIKLVTHSYGGR